MTKTPNDPTTKCPRCLSYGCNGTTDCPDCLTCDDEHTIWCNHPHCDQGYLTDERGDLTRTKCPTCKGKREIRCPRC